MLDSETASKALEQMRNLLQADGGDMEIVDLDLETAAVKIRLLLDGARCRACVLPRGILQNVVAHIMNEHGVMMQSIVIEDPREVVA
jgi:Fe-S cluster biogenesis protein NfuA